MTNTSNLKSLSAAVTWLGNSQIRDEGGQSRGSVSMREHMIEGIHDFRLQTREIDRLEVVGTVLLTLRMKQFRQLHLSLLLRRAPSWQRRLYSSDSPKHPCAPERLESVHSSPPLSWLSLWSFLKHTVKLLSSTASLGKSQVWRERAGVQLKNTGTSEKHEGITICFTKKNGFD